MEFLGIGPLELFFVVLIALILLGPKDMVKAGRTMGRILRKTILSPTFLAIQRTVRNLPYEMMREAGLEEADLKVKIDPINIPTNYPVTPSQPATEKPPSSESAAPPPVIESPEFTSPAPNGSPASVNSSDQPAQDGATAEIKSSSEEKNN
jgi:hypothetical protein